MKKLSILALAATALLISGANGIAANNNSLRSIITTRKEAAGDVIEISTSAVYNSSDWFSKSPNIAIVLNNIVGNGLGVLSSARYAEGSPEIKMYDVQGNVSPFTLVEGCGTWIVLNRAQPQNYKGYLLHVPANMSIITGAPYAGTNDYNDKILHTSVDTYFLCELDNGTAQGQWTEVQMPSSISVASENVTISTRETSQITASKVGGSAQLKFQYSSDDTTIATVDDNGVINGVNAGECNITVKCGLLTKTVHVTVTGAQAVQSGIKITNGKTLTVYQGNSYSLDEVKFVPLFGETEGAEIAVTAEMVSGEFKKDEIGTYTLTVTSEGFSDTFTVEVIAMPEVTMGDNTPGVQFGNNSIWGNFYVSTTLGDIGQYINIKGEELADLQNYVLINGEGNQLQYVKNLGGGRYEFWFNNSSFRKGDTITVLKGMKIYRYTGTFSGATHDVNDDGHFYAAAKLDKDYKYVFNGTSWEVYVGESTELDVKTEDILISIGEGRQIEYEVGPVGTYTTPTFKSENPEIATVTADGMIEGVAIGTTKIKVTVDKITREVVVNVIKAKNVKSINLTNIPNYYSFLKDSDTKAFAPEFTKAQLVFEDDTLSPEFTIETSAVKIGEFSTAVEGNIKIPVKITYKDVEYNSSLEAKVYTYYNQDVKEVAIVDWFAYAVFIQCDNTSTNIANITSGKELGEQLSKIKYQRKDGTEVKINGNYQLGANIAIFPSFLYNDDGSSAINDQNYNSEGFYEVGDVITIEENCPVLKWTGDLYDSGSDNHAMVPNSGEIIVEGTFTHTQQYKYNGSVWTSWIEYENIKLDKTEMTLEVNKTAKVPASRTPDNATQGSFSYVSSDPTVVSVTDNGVMKGLKAGTATITVTLSDPDAPEKTKTATLTVTVTDSITGFKLNTEGTLKVTKGTTIEQLLASLDATYTYTSGREGEKVEFSGASVVNYDPETLGEQTIVVTVTLDGKEITQTLTIEVVNKGGCSGSVIATSALISTLALAGAGVALLNKKKRK